MANALLVVAFFFRLLLAVFAFLTWSGMTLLGLASLCQACWS